MSKWYVNESTDNCAWCVIWPKVTAWYVKEKSTDMFVYVWFEQLKMIRGFIKFLCRRSVGFFSGVFLVLLVKESKKRRRKQAGKLMANSCSQPVNLPGARPLMNLLNDIIARDGKVQIWLSTRVFAQKGLVEEHKYSTYPLRRVILGKISTWWLTR